MTFKNIILILFALLLSNCASFNKNKLIEDKAEKGCVTEECLAQCSQCYNYPKGGKYQNLTNQEEVIKLLGQPSKKTLVYLELDQEPRLTIKDRCGVLWEWFNKTHTIQIIFDVDGRIHKKFQLNLMHGVDNITLDKKYLDRETKR